MAWKRGVQLCGCILFLLFLKAGCTLYPNFDTEMINLALESSERCKSGWNEAYDNLTVKYSRRLALVCPQKLKENFLAAPQKLKRKFPGKKQNNTMRRNCKEKNKEPILVRFNWVVFILFVTFTSLILTSFNSQTWFLHINFNWYLLMN